MGAVFHPAYWGSLIAILINLAVVAGRMGEAQEYYHAANSEVIATVLAALILTLIIFSVLRHYFAVSINVYSKSITEVLNMPKPFNSIVFGSQCAILIICNLVTFLFDFFTFETIIAFCIGASFLSILSLFSVYAGYKFAPRKITQPPNKVFMGTEGCFMIMLLISLFMATRILDGAPAESFSVPIGLVAAFVLFLWLNEIVHVHGRLLYKQLDKLFHKLFS